MKMNKIKHRRCVIAVLNQVQQTRKLITLCERSVTQGTQCAYNQELRSSSTPSELVVVWRSSVPLCKNSFSFSPLLLERVSEGRVRLLERGYSYSPPSEVFPPLLRRGVGGEVIILPFQGAILYRIFSQGVTLCWDIAGFQPFRPFASSRKKAPSMGLGVKRSEITNCK